MIDLCKSSKIAWSALGEINYERKSSEENNLKFRRSLYFIKDLKAGDTISSDSIKSIRPGFGLPPKFLDEVIGRTVNCDIKFGTPLHLDYLK